MPDFVNSYTFMPHVVSSARQALSHHAGMTVSRMFTSPWSHYCAKTTVLAGVGVVYGSDRRLSL